MSSIHLKIQQPHFQVMWDKSEHKANSWLTNYFFWKYSFKLISGGKFSVIFSMDHFHRKVDIESKNENKVL